MPSHPPELAAGLRCPACGCRHLEVVWTRQRNRGVVRCRRCRHCGRRIVTREREAGRPPPADGD